jgi:hypothetical protein
LNWDAIGAVGEILGAAAVVATLVYLAIQVRSAKSAAADINRLSRAVGVRETIRHTISDSELSDAWIRAEGSGGNFQAIADQLGLNFREAQKVTFQCQSWWWLHWGQWASITTEKDMAELKHLVSEFYSVPPISVVWAEDASVQLMDPDFIEFVNNAVLEKQRASTE